MQGPSTRRSKIMLGYHYHSLLHNHGEHRDDLQLRIFPINASKMGQLGGFHSCTTRHMGFSIALVR